MIEFGSCAQSGAGRAFPEGLESFQMSRVFVSSLSATFILCVGMCLLAGCHSRTPAPAIEFSRIPEANPGGPETQDIIEGFVTGAQPGQRIVLYVKSGRWYVQPLVTHPFTKLTAQAAGMKWTNATHLGTEYAALLVDQGYHPRPVVDELPKLGGPAGSAVVAFASTKGAASPPSKMVEFSGYSWRLRDAPSSRGGVSNNYSSNNVWVDKHGAMHMNIARAGDDWTCAEASLTRSLGYGTYKVTVRDTSGLPEAAVFSMFTWDYARPEESNGEMDMEFRHWPDRKENMEYVVPPYYVDRNAIRGFIPPRTVVHSLRWEPGRAAFQSVLASNPSDKPVAEAVFTSSVPIHGIESFRICLYIDRYHQMPLPQGSEVVIEKFEYLP